MTSDSNAIPEEYLSLVSYPSESLGTEFKRWLDLKDDEQKAKFVKAIIALYNNNGGRLVIGLRDDGSVDSEMPLKEIQDRWNADAVQEVVSKYISPPIEVATKIIPMGSAYIVVIEVPSGVRLPATAARQLHKIETHDLFVRTTESNHRYSSSKPTRHDWDQLIRTCMDNREVDIGTFFRRHLGVQPNLDLLRDAFTHELERVCKLLNYGDQRSREYELIRKNDQIGYVEIAFEFVGPTTAQQSPNQTFLRELQGLVPKYSGWPPFIFSEENPVVYDEGWEATVHLAPQSQRPWALDFWRIKKNGQFYTKRSLQDDTSTQVQPREFLDPFLHLRRIIEVMAIGVIFCQHMSYCLDKTQIAFAFRWTKLSGRQLWHWAHPKLDLPRDLVCHDDSATEKVLVPASTPLHGLATYVRRVGAGLMSHFRGYDGINTDVVQSIVNETLARDQRYKPTQ